MSVAETRPVEPGRGADAVALFMRPRSVAVVGVSAKPGTAGRTVLTNLRLNAYAGDVHVVGRAEGDIDGHVVRQSIDELPEGVDLAVFTLPAGAVKEALEACVRRGVRAVTIFSSGFAEIGNRDAQDELAQIARDAGIAMLGPNCLGYTNLVDGLPIGFANAREVPRVPKDGKHPAIAMVSQSGGLMAFASLTLSARALPVSYTVATGNEAGVGMPDFIDFFAADPVTRVIALYLEEVRDPQGFLAAAARARCGQGFGRHPSGAGRKGQGCDSVPHGRAGRRLCDDARPPRPRRCGAGRYAGGMGRRHRIARPLSGAAHQGAGRAHLLRRLLRHRP